MKRFVDKAGQGPVCLQELILSTVLVGESDLTDWTTHSTVLTTSGEGH